MTRRLGLIVTDASPLIALAAGEALDCLTMPGLRVVISGHGYFEVTQDLARTGAADIVAWARRHHGQIEITPTTVFSEFQIVRADDPNTRSKGRGELSATISSTSPPRTIGTWKLSGPRGWTMRPVRCCAATLKTALRKTEPTHLIQMDDAPPLSGP